MNKAEQAAGSRPKARRLSSQSLGSEQDESPAQASDLMVERLRAYEEVGHCMTRRRWPSSKPGQRSRTRLDPGNSRLSVVVPVHLAICLLQAGVMPCYSKPSWLRAASNFQLGSLL